MSPLGAVWCTEPCRSPQHCAGQCSHLQSWWLTRHEWMVSHGKSPWIRMDMVGKSPVGSCPPLMNELIPLPNHLTTKWDPRSLESGQSWPWNWWICLEQVTPTAEGLTSIPGLKGSRSLHRIGITQKNGRDRSWFACTSMDGFKCFKNQKEMDGHFQFLEAS